MWLLSVVGGSTYKKKRDCICRQRVMIYPVAKCGWGSTNPKKKKKLYMQRVPKGTITNKIPTRGPPKGTISS